MFTIQSYSCKIVTGILDEFKLSYSPRQTSMAIVHVQVNLPNNTRLSVNTHPDVAMWAFCETMGYVPKSFAENECDDPLRHKTPDDFKQFIIETLHDIYAHQNE